MKKFIIIFILIAGIFHSEYQMAQQISQVIRRVVTDNQSKVTLPGANVVIIGSAPFKGAAADPEGSFRITDVAPGRYDLKVSFMGYKDAVLSNVLVTSGKETILEIGLEENISTLNEVVITGKEKNETLN